MSTIIYSPGGTISKGPTEVKVVPFDWDTENLAAGVQITDSSWTIATFRPLTATLPTLDQISIGGTGRTTQVRLTGGTAGATYWLTNTITTNEGPTQIKARSIYVQVRTL